MNKICTILAVALATVFSINAQILTFGTDYTLTPIIKSGVNGNSFGTEVTDNSVDRGTYQINFINPVNITFINAFKIEGGEDVSRNMGIYLIKTISNNANNIIIASENLNGVSALKMNNVISIIISFQNYITLTINGSISTVTFDAVKAFKEETKK